MQHGKAHYPLKEVQALVKKGNWRVNQNALNGAHLSFGWGVEDIRKAILALQPCHFDISDWSRFKPGIMLDCYKAKNLRGEDIYMHFYIDNEEVLLVINSFKRI